MKASLPKLALTLAGLYCFASFTHFFHNAEFCGEYPNLPAWISRAGVYGAWLGVTAIGALGVGLILRQHHYAGLVTMAIYAALGFAGLGHYGLAPMAQHTTIMNLTIWFEVITAAGLFVVILRELIQRYPLASPTA